MRTRGRVAPGASSGSATVEMAILLPALFMVLFVFVQFFLCWQAQTTLDTIADTASTVAAAAGGETPAVDAQILSLIDAHHLPRANVYVQVSTDAGVGQMHQVDQAQSADAPPPASYHGTVTVALRYEYPLDLPYVARTWSIPASASQPATVLGGLAP